MYDISSWKCLIESLLTYSILIHRRSRFSVLLGGRLYWCDAGTHSIESCNLDGLDRKQLIKSRNGQYFGLVVDENYLYFTDWTRM